MTENVPFDPLAVEGRVRVLLLDARTGKVVQEAEGSNFLSRALTERILRVAQRYAFAHQHPVQFDDCAWTNFTHNADAAGFFQWMVLTNSAMAESPTTEREVPGLVVGYANRQTHTDADLRRGHINRAESTHSPNRTRWTFDWPTDRGNGTIQSVCWAHGSTGLTPLPDRLGCDAVLEWRSGIADVPCCSYDGDYWTNTASVIRRLSSIDGSLLWTSPAVAVHGALTNPLAVRGDHIFYLDVSTLRRLTISTGAISASLKSLSVPHNVALVGDILYFMPNIAHTTGSTLTIQRYNAATMADMPSVTIPNLPPNVDTRNIFPMGGNIVRVGPGNNASGIYHDVDVVSLTITPLGFRSPAQRFLARNGVVKLWVPTQETTYASTTALPATGMMYDVPSMAGNFLLSRIRLSGPIEKTTANTLKIIYDFNYA